MVFAIAGVAMALVGARPWRLSPWIWPALGAAIVIALGREGVADAVVAIAQQWNVLLFIFGLMGLAAAAEESGAFAWITAVLLERAGGSRRRLFVLLFVTGAALTLVLSNDATAIGLTPIVYRALVSASADETWSARSWLDLRACHSANSEVSRSRSPSALASASFKAAAIFSAS